MNKIDTLEKNYNVDTSHIKNLTINDRTQIYSLFDLIFLYSTPILLNPRCNIKPYWNKTERDEWIDTNLANIKYVSKDELTLIKSQKCITDTRGYEVNHLRIINICDLFNYKDLTKKQSKEKLEALYNIIYPKYVMDNYLQTYTNFFRSVPKEEDYSKYRVFFIKAHGYSCSLDTIKTKKMALNKQHLRKSLPAYFNTVSTREIKREMKKRRNRLSIVDTFKKLFDIHYYPKEHQVEFGYPIGKGTKEKLKYKPNSENIKIVTTQTFGRISPTMLYKIFLKMLRKDAPFYKTLYTIKSLNDNQILERYIDLNFYIYYSQYAKPSKSWEYKMGLTKLVDGFDFNYDKYKKTSIPSYFTPNKNSNTTNNIVNFSRYSKYNLPDNFEFSTSIYNDEDILGLFEITGKNSDIMNEYINIVTKKDEYKSTIVRMGLPYYIKTQIINKNFDKDNVDDFLKYNQYLYDKIINQNKVTNNKLFTLEDIIETIYRVGEIKPD